jgi:hypothetical protein
VDNHGEEGPCLVRSISRALWFCFGFFAPAVQDADNPPHGEDGR